MKKNTVKGAYMTQTPLISLNDGNYMPQLGLGVWKADDGDETKAAVMAAIKAGYRLIDTAMVYQNETGAARASRSPVSNGVSCSSLLSFGTATKARSASVQPSRPV